MKKIGSAAGIVITSSFLMANPVLAELPEDKVDPIVSDEITDTVEVISEEVSDEEVAPISEKEDVSDYIRATGTIKEIQSDEEKLTLIVEEPEESLITHFPLNEDVLIYSSATTEQFAQKDLEEGLQVEVYYDKSKPILTIYPATITPELLIVHDEEEMGSVKVGKFDDNLLSLDKELQLHISEETEIVNQQGEELAQEELTDYELMVFYTVANLSLPAQTTPSKIVALDPITNPVAELEKIIEEDHYIKDGTKMIPLRKVAEYLGNEVIWHQESYSITVKKLNRTFTITIGEEKYGYNKSLRQFDQVPEAEDGKTYVSEEFVDMLLNK